jgi:hypothetical protein
VSRSITNPETHTMTTKQKKTGAAAALEKAKTMPQDKFDAAVTEILTEASAAVMAVQAMLDARRQTAA